MQVGRAFQCMIVLGGKAVSIVVCRYGDLLVCRRVDEFRLPAVRYNILRCWNCNKVVCDLVNYYKAAVYACLV